MSNSTDTTALFRPAQTGPANPTAVSALAEPTELTEIAAADAAAPNPTDGTAQPQITPQRLARIRRVLALRQPDLTLVLANIHDPHNVSAIYRSCDAFGVDEVQLYYTHTPFPELGAKSSASARKWVRTRRHRDLQSLQNHLHSLATLCSDNQPGCPAAPGPAHPAPSPGCQVLATSCSPTARPLEAWDFTRPTAVIMGNEHAGVDPELLSIAHGELYIPMYGMIQSFNVSVAAAIILAEACRQRKLAGMYAAPRVSPAELERRIAEWIRK